MLNAETCQPNTFDGRAFAETRCGLLRHGLNHRYEGLVLCLRLLGTRWQAIIAWYVTAVVYSIADNFTGMHAVFVRDTPTDA